MPGKEKESRWRDRVLLQAHSSSDGETRNQEDEEDRHEDEEERLRDGDGRTRDGGESEKARDEADDEKEQGPAQHLVPASTVSERFKI